MLCIVMGRHVCNAAITESARAQLMGLRMIQQALRCSARVLATCEGAVQQTRLHSPFAGLSAARSLATPLYFPTASRLSFQPIRLLHSTLTSASATSTMAGQDQITYM